MREHGWSLRALSGIAMLNIYLGSAVAQEPGCRTGAAALADAYILANPIYAYYLGDLESYLAANKEHFREGGDAIRCSLALSKALLKSSFQLYDPSEQQRRDELNAELGAMGISPGPQDASPAANLLMMSLQLSRLARVLPPATEGDWGPFWTPTTELEQMQQQAVQAFFAVIQVPEMASILAQLDPMMRELASLEHRAIQEQAAQLAGPSN